MPAIPPNPALKNLVDALGEDDTREVVLMFLRDFPPMLQKIGAGDREEAQRLAHSLKSSSHHMGAATLARRLAALEDRLGQPGSAVTHDDLEMLAAEFDNAAGPLRAYTRIERTAGP